MTNTTFSQDTRTPVWGRRSSRWIAAGIAVALHLAILVLFLSSHPPLTASAGAGAGAGAMDVSLAGFARAASPSPARALPTTPTPTKPAPPASADPIKPRSVVQIVSDILAIPLPEHAVTPQPISASPTPSLAQVAAPASGPPGAACNIGGAVQAALRSDPGAHGAVLLIPHEERSVANAVLLWNGRWIDPADVGGATAFTTIKTSIREIVATAQPDCREREIVGPRFMLIPDGSDTIMVVVGTASWRWSDMLVDNPASFADSPQPDLGNKSSNA